MVNNILVACEESQAVLKELLNKGYNAFSCDIQCCSGGRPDRHILGDVFKVLYGNCSFITEDGYLHQVDKWDVIIGFPPCTDLAVSGSSYFEKKRNDGRQYNSIKFFADLYNAPCDYMILENPVNIIGGSYIAKYYPEFSYLPKATQFIQPYYFGHPVRKKTGLWLKNLPLLKPTNIVEPDIITVDYERRKDSYSGPAWYATDENGKILSWNDPRTAKIRSKTYPGVAKAIVNQYF